MEGKDEKSSYQLDINLTFGVFFLGYFCTVKRKKRQKIMDVITIESGLWQELINRIKYIRDELKITRIEAIRKELKDNDKHSDERQAALEILQRVREELYEIRKMIKS